MPAQQRQRNAGIEACAMPAMTPVQYGQGAGPSKAYHHAMMLGRATKPMAMMISIATSSHTLMCCGCVMTGQTPVCDAGSNAGAARVTTTPVQQGQRHPCNKGNDTSL
jgi:hypothetical protein